MTPREALPARPCLPDLTGLRCPRAINTLIAVVREPKLLRRVTAIVLSLGFLALSFRETAAVGLAILAIAVAATAFLLQPRRRLVKSTWPALAFFASVVLSIFVSVDRSRSGTFAVGMLPGLLIFLLVTLFLRAGDLLLLFRGFALVGLLLAALMQATALALPTRLPEDWIAATGTTFFVSPNDVCGLAVILPLAIVPMMMTRGRADRLLAAASTLLTLSTTLSMGSRGGLIAVLFALTSVFGLLTRRVLTVAAVCALSLAFAAWFDAVTASDPFARFGETWLTRVPTWWVALAMFADAPLLGHGLRSYGALYVQYISHFSTAYLWSWMEPRVIPWAHSLFLETLAEQGVVGLATLGAALGLGLRRAFPIAVGSGGPRQRLAAGTTASLATFCLVGLYETSFVRLWAVVVGFAVLGASAVIGRTAPAAPLPPAA